jgi:hypothetical protein
MPFLPELRKRKPVQGKTKLVMALQAYSSGIAVVEVQSADLSPDPVILGHDVGHIQLVDGGKVIADCSTLAAV